MAGNNQGNPANATPTYLCTGGAPKGYQQITDLSSAQPLTVPTGAVVAVIVAEGGMVRYRDDGTDPTANAGMPIQVAAPPLVYTGNLAAIKFIQQQGAAGDAFLNVLYYG